MRPMSGDELAAAITHGGKWDATFIILSYLRFLLVSALFFVG